MSTNFSSSLVVSFILTTCAGANNFKTTWKLLKKSNLYSLFSEREIPNNISCFKLLIHWNSQLGEGKGQSHVALTHRLKQLGHENLANWLSRTVFHQLGQDLNRTLLMNPFKELVQTAKPEARYLFTSLLLAKTSVKIQFTLLCIMCVCMQ